MLLSFTEKKNIRKNFGKLKEGREISACGFSTSMSTFGSEASIKGFETTG